MATPFTIDLISPYIMITPTTSKYNLSSQNSLSVWGEVYQINASTTSVIVGDLIFYKQSDASAITDDGGNLFYILDENKIQFIEV